VGSIPATLVYMKIKSINPIRQYIYTQKKTKPILLRKSLNTRFNLGKKNYRPVFIKKKNLFPSLGSKLHVYTHLPYNTHYNYYNHLQQIYLQDTNTKKSLKYLPSAIVNFYTSNISSNKIINPLYNITPQVKSVTLNLTNSNMYYVNSLIDYYLSFYVLSKYRIHSKKASIIIAQVIDSGHFSRRTVYLSNTQSTSLKYKAKLTNYFNLSIPTLYNINPLLILSRTPIPLDFNFYNPNLLNKVNTLDTPKTITNFRSLEDLLKNLLNLV